MNEVIPNINTNKKIALSAIKAILGQIPVVNLFSDFCNEFVNANWQERIEYTQEELLKRFSELDEQFEEKIRERSNFSSLLATAYQSALSDIDKDKIPLYINSLINAIKNESLDNTKIHIFLNFLKEFTLLHIEALNYFSTTHENHYSIAMELNRCSIPTKDEVAAKLIKYDNPELIRDIDLFNNVMNDLNKKGLIYITRLSEITNKVANIRQPIEKYTTSFGDEFLEFIKEHEG